MVSPDISMATPIKKPRIMLLEGDTATRVWLTGILQANGYAVDAACSAEEAAGSERPRRADITLLGFSQWGVTERSALKAVRREPAGPVLVMAPHGAESEDRRAIIQAGADDIVARPVDISELLVRIQALLYRPGDGGHGAVLVAGELVIDTVWRTVSVADARVDLTEVEYQILRGLVLNAGRTLSPSELCRLALGPDYEVGLYNLPLVIQNLHQKIEIEHHQCRCIHRDRQGGYRFEKSPGEPGRRMREQL